MAYCITHNQSYEEKSGGFCYQCRGVANIKVTSTTTTIAGSANEIDSLKLELSQQAADFEKRISALELLCKRARLSSNVVLGGSEFKGSGVI